MYRGRLGLRECVGKTQPRVDGDGLDGRKGSRIGES